MTWWAWLAGGVLVFIVLMIISVAWVIRDSAPEDCDGFEFDSGNWTSGDAAEEAASLVRCKTLKGLTHEEVINLLGEDSLTNRSRPSKKRWTFHAGEVNGYSGPADAQSLYVSFDHGVVVGTGLTYPEDD